MDEFMGWKQEISMKKERKKKKDSDSVTVWQCDFFSGGSFLFI